MKHIKLALFGSNLLEDFVGRPIKREKTKMEILIRKTWENTNRGKAIVNDEQRRIVAAIKCTLKHFMVRDKNEGPNHKSIFEFIYLSKFRKITQKQAADEFHYSERTIETYCKKYINVFEDYLSDE